MRIPEHPTLILRMLQHRLKGVALVIKGIENRSSALG